MLQAGVLILSLPAGVCIESESHPVAVGHRRTHNWFETCLKSIKIEKYFHAKKSEWGR